MQLESKIGTIKKPEKEIFEYLINFKNFEKFIQPDKLKNWYAEEESCRFSVDMAGEIEMSIINKEPNKTIKISGQTKAQPIEFLFWIQLKEVAENNTKIKLTVRAELPMMVKMMAKKPLQEAIDALADRIGEIFEKSSLRK